MQAGQNTVDFIFCQCFEGGFNPRKLLPFTAADELLTFSCEPQLSHSPILVLENALDESATFKAIRDLRYSTRRKAKLAAYLGHRAGMPIQRHAHLQLSKGQVHDRVVDTKK